MTCLSCTQLDRHSDPVFGTHDPQVPNPRVFFSFLLHSTKSFQHSCNLVEVTLTLADMSQVYRLLESILGELPFSGMVLGTCCLPSMCKAMEAAQHTPID
jgi:hypothetical protein